MFTQMPFFQRQNEKYVQHCRPDETALLLEQQQHLRSIYDLQSGWPGKRSRQSIPESDRQSKTHYRGRLALKKNHPVLDKQNIRVADSTAITI
ncbi:MAG: hypothetical protein KDF65_06395 [Anaerolineae bacterium]|nr:hypothetical protein [Anaerolineae bacterium]